MEFRRLINSISGFFRTATDSLLGVIYPKLCEVCGDALVEGEGIMCLACLSAIPDCRIDNLESNQVHQRLAGHAPIERAVAGFHYIRDNRYTMLIQAAKYNGRPRIAAWLAGRMAEELKPKGFFDGIDIIAPVPLHFLKELRRGYNQSEYIASALSAATGIPVVDLLKCNRNHPSQTRRGAFERWLNARDTYSYVYEDSVDGKHILVVDDVITTGATLLSCCEAIHNSVPSAKLSVLALAITDNQ